METTDIQVKSRTITLTGRAPVKIRDEEWPLIASDSWHDGKVECEAVRRAWLKVRQHADGRTLVYGGSSSNYAGARDLRGGELLVAGDDIAAAIHRVALTVGADQIAESCIADLPAQEV